MKGIRKARRATGLISPGRRDRLVDLNMVGCMKMKTICTIVFALLLAGCNVTTSRRSVASITNLKFGEAVFIPTHMLAGRVEVIRETTTLTFSTEQDAAGHPTYQFGYTFDYRSDTTDPEFKLVIAMPGKPAEIKLGDVKAEVGSLEHTIETKKTLSGRSGTHGYIFHFSEGDPLGAWRFDFYLGDVLQKSIDVEVVKQ